MKPLLLDGGRFSITYLLSALIEYNIFAYLIGRVSGPEAIAVYNVMITVHFSLTGVVQMVTIPLWPALVNAHSKGDYAWIRHSARRIRLMGPAFGLAVGLGLTTLGTWAFPLWMGEEFHISRAALATFSAYFFLHIWRHVNQVVVLGLGLIDACVKTLVAEASISLALVAFVLWTGGNLATVYGVLALCLLGATGWIFPLLSVREQMRLETGPAGAPDTVPEAGFEAPVTPESVVA